MSDSGYSNMQNMNNSHMMGGGSTYSSLLDDQVYNKHGRTGGSNPYGKDKSAYSDSQNWDKAKIYQDAERNNGMEIRKFKRFNDLKILNEQMIYLANNMQSINSPLEILSQGQKGEIKNILSKRIFKTSIMPALFAFILSLIVIFTDYLLVTLIAISFYIFIIGRTFYYPAKLYYENVQYKTTKHAELFYEEMDYWFKISAINIIIFLLMVTVGSIIAIFFENDLIDLVYNLGKEASGSQAEYLIKYAESISYSLSLSFLILLYIGTIIIYFKFINSVKAKNELIRKERLRSIRNETMSRVEQIQVDKNEL